MTVSTQSRRALVLTVATTALAALAACSKDEGPNVRATSNNFEKVKSKVGDLESAVESLMQAIGRFDDDNWREVVPDVRNAASEVESVLADLKEAMTGNDS
jgi:hypothetical protein